jgi:ABC-type transporter Mla subunit MlaD
MRRIFAIAVVTACGAAALIVGVGASDPAGEGYQVRAIFDNVSGAVEGEDVKVAGAKVGAIKELDVTPEKKAVVVLEIDEEGFAPFREDARCTIRPQSLIGEKFVECDPGSSELPPLQEIPDGEEGEGEYLLPVENTSSPVDLDLINDIMRLPYRERLALLINEFGTALAGRGAELNEVIHRANPALRETDEVLKILANQNRTLANLARDGDAALAPLARERARVASFIVEAGETAQASAERRTELSQTFERLPRFLAELKPTMEDLGALSDEMTPVIADLGDAAPDLNRFILALGPFSRQAIPSLDSLGDALEVGGPALQRSEPLIEDVAAFAKDADPLSRDLAALVTSFDETGGIERLMDYIFFQVTAINGFDSLSHYLRAGLLASAACSRYQITVAFGCEATFGEAEVEGAAAGRASAKVEPRIASTKPPEDDPGGADDIGSLGDDIERITRIEDPAIEAQREQRLEELREGAQSAPTGPYGEEQPFLDYLLGNDE